MIEINSAPDRRDLNDVHARAAARAGVRIIINSDAHGANTLPNTRWGVATARRAWLTAGGRGQHAAVGGVRAAAQARAPVGRRGPPGLSGSPARSAAAAPPTTVRSTAARRNGASAASARSA